MKHFLVSLFFLFACFSGMGQLSDTAKVFTFVEQNPEFPGGDAGLVEFLQENIKYPEAERQKGIQGRVLLRFVVMEDGRVEEVAVTKSVSPALDNEAVRVVKMLPRFKPGTQQGKPVRVYFNLPITFKFSDSDSKGLELVKEKMTKDAHFNNATKLIQLEDYKSAIKELKASIKKYPADFLGYELKAECELKLNNFKGACEDFKLALEKGSTTADKYLTQNCK